MLTNKTIRDIFAISIPEGEAEFHENVSKDSSISNVLCGNTREKQLESSMKEEEIVRVNNSLTISKEMETRNVHFMLYGAALRGDWSKAEKICKEHEIDITAKISKEENTALHIAAAARHTDFVKKLLERMTGEDLAVKNNDGNTAFFLAAASGEVEIVKAMMEKNGNIAMNRGINDMLPLHKAALMGNEEMVQHLYEATEDELLYHDCITLLVSLINSGLYDAALQIVDKHPEIATARDKNGETALHSLARMPILTPIANPYQEGMLKPMFKLYIEILRHRIKATCSNMARLPPLERKKLIAKWNKLMERRNVLHSIQISDMTLGWIKPPVSVTSEMPPPALELVKRLWEQVMLLDDSKIYEIVRKPWPLIFTAAKQGNLAFLKIIFSAFPDLMFEVDENNFSIFHFAVLYRHPKIFKLVHEMGSLKDSLLQRTDTKGNNILHLAARLPPPDKPNIESGLTLQLQEELLWFKGVKKLLHPVDVEAINNEGKTARAIFTEQHEKLKEKAEKWIKDTVNSCMIVATLIATVVFAAAFTVPGGTNEKTGTSYFSWRAAFIIFAISDATALLLSTFSILRFLSVISSRYNYEDFIGRLPYRLSSGLAALSLSISAMLIVFCATIFMTFRDGMLWIPILVTVMAFLTVLFFNDRFIALIEGLNPFSKRSSLSFITHKHEDSIF